MDNGGLVLADKIYTTIKNNNFISFIILGNRDIGKSTYALKALYEAFLKLGYSKKEAWILALSCIHFRIPSVIDYLKEGTDLYKSKGVKQPALIWDDLRKYASGQEYHIDRILYKELTGLLDTIKIPINVFIGTCPSMKGVMGILQDYDSYQINVQYSTRGGQYRLAKGYLWKTSPSGKRNVYSKFTDTFRCWLPTKIWKKYEMEKRIPASEESIEALETIAQKKEIAKKEWKIRQYKINKEFKKLNQV